MVLLFCLNNCLQVTSSSSKVHNNLDDAKSVTTANFSIDAGNLPNVVEEAHIVFPSHVLENALDQQKSTCHRAPLAKNVTSSDGQCQAMVDDFECVGKCVSIDTSGKSLDDDDSVTTGNSLIQICQKCSPVKFRKEKIQLTCQDRSQKQKMRKVVQECACAACWAFLKIVFG